VDSSCNKLILYKIFTPLILLSLFISNVDLGCSLLDIICRLDILTPVTYILQVTSINSDVNIQSLTNITNLVSVNGTITIDGTSISSLAGLNNLTSTQGFIITNVYSYSCIQLFYFNDICCVE